MKKILALCCILTLSFLLSRTAFALDSEETRKTLIGIKGVHIMVEELQPNVLKYAKNQDVTKEELQRRIENQLRVAGIVILNRDEWLRTIGRPLLYVDINTHEFQKYQFAYDIRVEFRQIVSLEANPAVIAFAPTWSLNMTGAVNAGTVGTIYGNVRLLVGSFVSAYSSVNSK
jgi:hypothetical protein